MTFAICRMRLTLHYFKWRCFLLFSLLSTRKRHVGALKNAGFQKRSQRGDF